MPTASDSGGGVERPCLIIGPRSICTFYRTPAQFALASPKKDPFPTPVC